MTFEAGESSPPIVSFETGSDTSAGEPALVTILSISIRYLFGWENLKFSRESCPAVIVSGSPWDVPDIIGSSLSGQALSSLAFPVEL